MYVSWWVGGVAHLGVCCWGVGGRGEEEEARNAQRSNPSSPPGSWILIADQRQQRTLLELGAVTPSCWRTHFGNQHVSRVMSVLFGSRHMKMMDSLLQYEGVWNNFSAFTGEPLFA